MTHQPIQQPTIGIRAWNQFCYRKLFAIDLRSLALFRISIALVMLADLASRVRDLSSIYAQAGALPLQAVHDYYGESWKWSLHLWSDAWEYQMLLFALATIVGLALLVGWHTRVAICAAWVITASLNTRTPLLMNGGDVLLCMGLFWGMFLPLQSRFSIDARRRRQQSTDSNSALSVASAGILLQIAMMYLFTGLWKFNPLWVNGEALQIALSDTAITRPFGNWLLGYPRLLQFLTKATLGLELIGPLLLLAPVASKYLRPIALVALVGLHVGIEMSMTVLMFSYASLAMLTLFVPASWWNCCQRPRSHEGDASASDQAENALSFRSRFGWPSWLKPLGQVLGSCCIGYIALYNVFALKYQKQWPATLAPFSQVATLLQFGQRWSMFDHPDQHLFRFAFYGRLKNGKTVDLLRNQVIDGNVQRPDTTIPFPTQRWMLLYRELTSPNNFGFRHDVARYLSQQWNQNHPESEQFLEGEFVVYLDHRSGDPSKTKKYPLIYYDGRANGPIRSGFRHGKWIERHDNGQQSAAGYYKMGLETGDWVFWNERGKREAAGAFVGGKRQGEWTFWEDDGSVKRGLFRDDKAVQRLP